MRNSGKVQWPASPGPVCARFVPPQNPSETQSPDDVVSRIQLSPLIFLGQNPIYGCSNGLDRARPFLRMDDDSWSCEPPSVKTCHDHHHHCVHLVVIYSSFLARNYQIDEAKCRPVLCLRCGGLPLGCLTNSPSL